MTLYDVLGVAPDASSDEIHRAYRELAKTYHPDRNAGDENAKHQFNRISDACDVLSDPLRRREYDETGKTKQHRDTDQDMLGVVVPHFLQAINDAANGFNGIETTDLVLVTRRKIEEQLRMAEEAHERMTKDVKTLETVHSRLEVTEGPNLLAESVASGVRQLQGNIECCKADMDRFTRALAWLKNYKYKFSGYPFGNSVRDIAAMHMALTTPPTVQVNAKKQPKKLPEKKPLLGSDPYKYDDIE